MAELTNPYTGHKVSTDDASVEFWTAAGYVADKPAAKAPAKAAPKKSPSK